jgi:multiple antibiotic resistance protein
MDLASALARGVAVFLPLFVAMDPVGTLPFIVSWTADLAPRVRAQQFRDALVTALILGLVFIVGGRWLLGILGIGVADFLIAGGLVLLALAISDVVAGGGHEGRGISPRPDFGAVPIGTPLLAGPATLATLLALAQQFGPVLTGLALVANLLIAWWLFQHANRLTRLMGLNGLRALSKVASLLLAAIAVKLIRDGLLGIAPFVG